MDNQEYNEIIRYLWQTTKTLESFEELFTKILDDTPDSRDYSDLKKEIKETIATINDKIKNLKNLCEENQEINIAAIREIIAITNNIVVIVNKIYSNFNENTLKELRDKLTGIEKEICTSVPFRNSVLEAGELAKRISKLITDFKTVSLEINKEIKISDIHEIAEFCKTSNKMFKRLKTIIRFFLVATPIASGIIGVIWAIYGDKIKPYIPFLN